MNTLDNDFLADNGLKASRTAQYDWLQISKWALFLSIVGFVFLAIGLYGLTNISRSFEMMSAMGAMGGGDPTITALFSEMTGPITVMIVVVYAIQFAINYFQLMFSLKLKQAVNNTDQQALEQAWLNFRNLFRTVGIIFIVLILFFVGVIGLISSIAASQL